MTVPAPEVIDLLPEHAGRLIDLNNAHAMELSLLDLGRFERMIAMAFHARQVADRQGFMLAFDERADYDSPNFLWFADRYDHFVYVDRIVIAPNARGRGLARLLYEDLTRTARWHGHGRIVCEVNSHPPNPASDAFHAAMGFAEVGGAALGDAGKIVRYLCLEIG